MLQFNLEEAELETTTAIDFSRNVIRFYKDAWHKIGEPKYIQILVHPELRLVGIIGVDKDEPREQTYRINVSIMQKTASSYEIHCTYLLRKIQEIIGVFEECGTYRMSGKIMEKQRLAIFHLDTLKHTED